MKQCKIGGVTHGDPSLATGTKDASWEGRTVQGNLSGSKKRTGISLMLRVWDKCNEPGKQASCCWRELSGELENRSQQCDVWLDQHQFKDIREGCPENCERSVGAEREKKPTHRTQRGLVPHSKNRRVGCTASSGLTIGRWDEARPGQSQIQLNMAYLCIQEHLRLFCSIVGNGEEKETFNSIITDWNLEH